MYKNILTSCFWWLWLGISTLAITLVLKEESQSSALFGFRIWSLRTPDELGRDNVLLGYYVYENGNVEMCHQYYHGIHLNVYSSGKGEFK